MSDSIITQCPNCSTTFRVSDDVLKMAQGKVRCGQCFHIFAAQPFQSSVSASKVSSTPTTPKIQPQITKPATKTKEEPIPPPDWLNSLVEEEKRLKESQEQLTPYQQRVLSEHKQLKSQNADKVDTPQKTEPQPAPWEIELAELEAAQKSTPVPTPDLKRKKQTKAPQKQEVALTKTASQSLPPVTADSSPQPEYMQALEELAKSSDQPLGDENYVKDAQQKLSELIDEEPETAKALPTKKRHTGLWFLGSMFACAILAIQLIGFNFETGSRSATFRPIYQVACTYYGCRLPTFEDVNSIDVQYVRVQSHPTRSNALLVNAIMTNTSPFSQPMPKMALEFFDLNGKPVAARLFSQHNYLDKDFLDITYMPPNTPIHLVIPISDPGAAAVTHQLTAHPATTRSF